MIILFVFLSVEKDVPDGAGNTVNNYPLMPLK